MKNSSINQESFDLSKSTISLFSAVGAVSVLVGAIMWLTSVANDAKANTKDLSVLQTKQDLYLQEIRTIREDIVEIKTILRIKDHKKEK